MILGADVNNKTVLDMIVEDNKHYLTKKRFKRETTRYWLGSRGDLGAHRCGEGRVLSQEGLPVEGELLLLLLQGAP